ncbi:MAG: hypothetical protein ACJZ5X_03375 [Opitutales bacterium]
MKKDFITLHRFPDRHIYRDDDPARLDTIPERLDDVGRPGHKNKEEELEFLLPASLHNFENE